MFGIFQSRVFDKVIYKFSLIFTGIYCVLFFGESFNNKIFFYLFISILTAIGISGIGYILNDIKDYRQDIIAKKRNLFIEKNLFTSILIVIFCLTASILPWFYLPFTKISFYLLLLEIILFIVYAIPPFRLKERGIFGVICDALYAQVIPFFLAFYTFSLLGKELELKILYTIIGILWLLLVGIRNIIYHQIEDYENDIKSETKTFVTKIGKEKVYQKIFPFLFFFEILFFTFNLYFLNVNHYFLITIYCVYFITITLLRYREKQTNFGKNNVLISKSDFINKKVLNEFYEIHLPIISLLYFSFQNHHFIWLLCFHLVFFSSIYINYIKGFIIKYS